MGEESFFESPRANSTATHWKSQRGGVASAEMCVRRDTSLAGRGQRYPLYSTFKCEQLSASLLACLDTKHFLPVSKHARKTHCRKNHADAAAASGVLSETASEFEAEEASLPPLPLLLAHCTNMGVPRVKTGGESVALTKWAGRVCATELNSSVKSDCTPSNRGMGWRE